MRLMQIAKRAADQIDDWNARIGRAVSWLSLILVVWVTVDVILRYLLNWSRVWMMEVETYLFSTLFLLSSAWAWQNDKHVRVDIFYQKMSPRRRDWTNWWGTTVLLLPWTWILMQVGWQYFIMSWTIGEGSSQSGGLGGVYVLKGIFLLAFVLLFLQAVARWIQLSVKLFTGEKE